MAPLPAFSFFPGEREMELLFCVGIGCLIPPNPASRPLKICVEKCPDRYLTYLNAHRSQDFEYYKQFCVPGFQNNKVRGAQAGPGGGRWPGR